MAKIRIFDQKFKASFCPPVATERKVFQFAPLYSGGECDVDGFGCPAIVDLSTMTIDHDPPALLDHNPDWVVGHLENIRIETDDDGRSSVTCDAIVEGTEYAQTIINYVNHGPVNLKPSIGIERFRWYDVDYYDHGQTATINGQHFIGPVAVIRNGHLTEGSFVVLAGDPNAKSLHAAFNRLRTTKGQSMTWEQFLEQQGVTQEMFDALPTEEKEALKTEFESDGALEPTDENAQGITLDEENMQADGDLSDVQPVGIEPIGGDAVKEAVAEAVAEEVSDMTSEEAARIYLDVVAATSDALAASNDCDPKDEEKLVQAAKRIARTKVRAKMIRHRVQARERRAVHAGVAESRRVAAVKAVCSTYGRNGATICGKAIAGGWSYNQTERYLKSCLARDGRTKNMNRSIPAGRDAHGTPRRQNVLTAAFAVNCGLKPDYIKQHFRFDDATMNAAMESSNRRVSFKRLVHDSVNSFKPGACNVDTSMLDAVHDMRVLCRNHHNNFLSGRVQASMGFSTISATDILKAVIQAYLLDQPDAAPTFYRQITKEQAFTDFNSVDAYMPTLIGKLSKISETGQLENVSYSTTKLTTKTEPLGAMFTIPEMVLINDQLSAFVTLLEQFRDLPDQCIEHDTADLFARMVDGNVNYQGDSAAFFSTLRGNILTGAESALGESGLTMAEMALDDMKNDNGVPLSAEGAFIVCGSSLFAKASRLYASENLNVVDTIGEKNVFAGKYQPFKWVRLNANHARLKKDNGSTDSDLQTYKNSQWYMFRDPTRRPVMTVNKLVGYETPQIREFDADPSVWGTTYQLIYPYKVDACWPDGALVMRGA